MGVCESYQHSLYAQDHHVDCANLLDEKLGNLVTPKSITDCQDMKCRNPIHKEDLDNYTLNLLETLQEVVELTLPKPKATKTGVKKKVMPGWI